MMDDQYRRARQWLADIRAGRVRELSAEAPAPVTAADRVGSPFAVGDRVFDRRGGREGEVADVQPGNVPGAVRVVVVFDDGGASIGPASDLIARPRPPAGRS